MAFDKNLPANDSDLNLGPSFIRANWAAIEGAENSLAQVGINLAEQTGDLALNVDTYRLFSKSDGTNTEFYGINSAGNVSQLTKGLPVIASAETSLFLAGGLIVKLGIGAFSGGAFTRLITYTTPFPTSGFGALMTNIGSSSTAFVSSIIPESFTAQRGAGGNSGAFFYWLSWGN